VRTATESEPLGANHGKPVIVTVTINVTVIIVTVVINELDGLSRSIQSPRYSHPEQGIIVQAESRLAVEFLEAEFEARNHRLCALTQAGTELDTITYRSEEAQMIVCYSTSHSSGYRH